MCFVTGSGLMLQTTSPQKVLYLTGEASFSPITPEGVWPIPPTDPPITIPGINEDGSHFPVEKIEAHVKGLHHQALSIFVFCQGELLIQQRAAEKYHCGGLWANTCCSHPHFGEDVADAADRRLMEELGFLLPLEQRLIVEYSADVGNGLWERERVHMFRTEIASKDQLAIALNPEEVQACRWVTCEALREEIDAHPEIFTPWYRIYVKEYARLDF